MSAAARPKRPTIAELTEQLRIAEARIHAAQQIHRPVHNGPVYRVAGHPSPTICVSCRTPYPCDTALALGTR